MATDTHIPKRTQRLAQNLGDYMDLISKEAALIVYSARMDWDTSTRGEVESIISSGVNWRRVLSIARSNGVFPVFRENLLRYCPEKVPYAVKAQIQDEFQRCAGESLGYARELTRIAACLEQYRVRAIAFKGPALAQQLQQKLSLRRCRDLDIFIEKSQFEEATAAIQSAGYSVIWPDDEVGRAIFRSDKHILLIAETGRFRVELHWSLALPGFCFPLRFEDLWSRREQISVLGTSIPVPGKEDLLLILCFHAATHWWGSLKWICDIAEFLKRYPNLDWELVLARARKLGCCRILLTGVTLAQITMALRLPETLDREARLDRFIEQVKKDVLCRLSIGAPPLQGTERYLAHVRSRERLWDRLKLVINLVSSRLKPNARDREWIYLPDALGFLYIPLRIIRVICLRYKASVRPLLRAVVSSN